MRGVLELDELKSAVLMEGEWLQDGWAAERVSGEQACAGFFLLTNCRVAFVTCDGSFSAAPIGKIYRLESGGEDELVLLAWHERFALRFDSADGAAVVANRLRQDSQWAAVSSGPERAVNRVAAA